MPDNAHSLAMAADAANDTLDFVKDFVTPPLPNIHLSTSLTNAQVLARQAWEALDDEREGDLTRLVNDLKVEVDQIHDLVIRW
jgi:hypothetical protein